MICPECKEAVQDRAIVCRHCGYRFGSDALNWIAGAVVAIVLAIIVINQ